MTYPEVLTYLYNSLPVYQRIGAAAYKANLDNTLALAQCCHYPEKKFKSIHIAGTNGKGSTSSFLASIFTEAGYKTGLYTSPHLIDFRERIRINGVMISEEAVMDFVLNHKSDFERISPSFFEMTVALAFDYFAREKVDIAIVEVGMGGRLDSTNIITPEISVITNISKDHTAFLGNTLEAIAGEKAGIIKPHIPVIIGETQPETAPVFKTQAGLKNAPIIFADQNTDVYDFEIPLKGIYQQKNIKTVYAAVRQINLQNRFNLSEDAVKRGIQNVVKNTGLQGRWQIIKSKPLVVCDTGHNAAGIEQVTAQIEQTPHQNLHIILSVVNDKDLSSILPLFPKNAQYYFTQSSVPRALPVQELATAAHAFGLNGISYPDVSSAYFAAEQNATEEDMIFIGGSTFTVADFLGIRN